jgi:glycosyltransferase involved in cell wall biosynthesis
MEFHVMRRIKNYNVGDPRIAISLCTYNHAERLVVLLEALDKQRLKAVHDGQILVIIVDNCETGSANEVGRAYGSCGRFSSVYVSERRKGLAFARNSALTAARDAGATHVAFIDDDEVPEAEWLDSLFLCLCQRRAAAAIGPVYPVFETPPPAWLAPSSFVRRRSHVKGLLEDGYTSNCIVDMLAIDSCSLRFEMRFNETGGEDTFFFRELVRRGGKIAWAEDAIVHEFIPRNKMSAKWLWRRWYRTGALEAELSQYDASSALGKVITLTRGLARIVVGSGYVIAGSVRGVLGKPEAFVASFYTMCRGAGLVAKVFGHDYREYSASNYS